MSWVDVFKGKKYKAEKENLEKKLADIEKLLTPEMNDAIKLKEYTAELNKQMASIQTNIFALNSEIERLQQKKSVLQDKIVEREAQIIHLDEEIMLQEFGLYKPRYDFQSSEQYKDRLEGIRQHQKQLIKDNKAVTGNQNWTVNGSKAQGQKMLRDMQKLLLRAFNSECDDLIEHVKYNTYETAKKRMDSSYAAISKLGSIMDVAITYPYYSSKCAELSLALEYRQKKQEEKEEQKALKAQMREEAKLAKEIEEARKKIEKEQKHYTNALTKINQQIAKATDDEKQQLMLKKEEIENELLEIDKSIKNIDYREANAKAGYVYVISNIGAFGDNVYKIGMTRRLDPYERVDELGDASVPFDFDVHAMIFSEDAPKLEAALHKAFESKKINMVNTRREFFAVTLDEIKEEVKKNYDKTAEFKDIADAEQFRISEKMKSK
ncbi:MAG: DUF4041 domain-containing protein [Clostridia bacterium]|nr:DUF4041 domain-containing protein [Clostridia bacterium]